MTGKWIASSFLLAMTNHHRDIEGGLGGEAAQPSFFFPQSLVIAMEIEERNLQKQSLLICFFAVW
jgi:hypothetical protein